MTHSQAKTVCQTDSIEGLPAPAGLSLADLVVLEDELASESEESLETSSVSSFENNLQKISTPHAPEGTHGKIGDFFDSPFISQQCQPFSFGQPHSLAALYEQSFDSSDSEDEEEESDSSDGSDKASAAPPQYQTRILNKVIWLAGNAPSSLKTNVPKISLDEMAADTSFELE